MSGCYNKSGDLPTCCELSWRLGESVRFLFETFGFFELTMVVVKGREGFFFKCRFYLIYLEFLS